MSDCQVLASTFRNTQRASKASVRGSKPDGEFLLQTLKGGGSYLSPGGGEPLQPVVAGAAPQDAGLLGFGSVVLPTHAVRNHHGRHPGVGAAAEHAPLPQPAAAAL